MSTASDQAQERAERGLAARREVERRVIAAIDRLDVLLQFREPSPACLAQSLHAIHYLERGWAGESTRELVEEAPDFQLDHDSAEELAHGLVAMLAAARRSKHLVREIE